jgi:hypothetical protein
MVVSDNRAFRQDYVPESRISGHAGVMRKTITCVVLVLPNMEGEPLLGMSVLSEVRWEQESRRLTVSVK